jgi:hypothetical protein
VPLLPLWLLPLQFPQSLPSLIREVEDAVAQADQLLRWSEIMSFHLRFQTLRKALATPNVRQGRVGSHRFWPVSIS